MPTGNVIYVQQYGPRTVSHTPDTTGAQSDLTPLTTILCCLEHKKHLSILVSFHPYTITKQFAFKNFVWKGVNSFFKVQNESVNLTLFVQYFCPIIYYCNLLSFTTMPFPECMLFVRQKIILVKMTHGI